MTAPLSVDEERRLYPVIQQNADDSYVFATPDRTRSRACYRPRADWCECG
jgi:hypothetical protein